MSSYTLCENIMPKVNKNRNGRAEKWTESAISDIIIGFNTKIGEGEYGNTVH